MEEVKSALEKALERAKKLGELSADELRKSEEKEYIPIGEGMAKRYLRHGSSSILVNEINKYSQEKKDMVTKGVLSMLRQIIGLENKRETERALDGIGSLRGEENIDHICKEIENLVNEYHQVKQQRYEEAKGEIEKSGRELLHRLRISGSAIGEINPKISEAWELIVAERRSRFNNQLSELKQSLAKALE